MASIPPVLMPIAAVDTSSAADGVSMFSLSFDAAMLTGQNIIQFEYRVFSSLNPLPGIYSGFIPLENAVSSQGISNVYTIAIPSNNSTSYSAITVQVSVRIYFGAQNGSGIIVSEWSSDCPLSVPPAKPGVPVALLVPGEGTGVYEVPDKLYVQISDPSNNYSIGSNLRFIVSYCYKDRNESNKWVVSDPLAWELNDATLKLLFQAITLPVDMASNTTLHVAVNAVYNYSFDEKTYYSVSEISDTVTATEATLDVAPSMDPVVYNLYDGEGTASGPQSVSITWQAAAVAAIPNFTVTGYFLIVTIDDVEQEPIEVSDFAYDYSIPNEYLPGNTLVAASFAFAIQAVYGSEKITSISQTIKTYSTAGQPSNPVLQWASTTPDNKVDIMLSFAHPSDPGLSSALSSAGGQGVYTIIVYDDNDDEVTRVTRNYTAAVSGSYRVFFNNVATTPTGHIELYLTTQDNSSTTRFDGSRSTVDYTAYEIPQFVNPSSWTNAAITCTIATQTLLGKYGVIAIHEEGVSYEQFSTVAGNNGALFSYSGHTVSYTVNEDDESYMYTIVFAPAFFGVSIPGTVNVGVSNGMGIGHRTFSSD